MSNSQWHGGKGSGRRTASIPDSEMSARWDAIFGKKKAEPEQKENKDELSEQTKDADQ